MPIKYEVVSKREGKDGKAFWTKIGVVFETAKGLSLKMEAVPVAWDGWAILSDPTQKKPAKHQGDEDVPF